MGADDHNDDNDVNNDQVIKKEYNNGCETQEVSVWLDDHEFSEDVKDGDEELYESIYEVIQPLHHHREHQNSNNCSFESESDFDEIYADPSVTGSDDQLKELN